MNYLDGKIKWLALPLGDIAMLYAALWLTLKLRYGDAFTSAVWDSHILPFTVLYAVWLFIFYLLELYNPRAAKNDFQSYLLLAKALAICVVVGALFFYLIPYFKIAPKTNLLLAAVFIFSLLSLWRFLFNKFLAAPFFPRSILIIGTPNPQTLELERYIHSNLQLGYRICGILDPDAEHILSKKHEYPNSAFVVACSLHDHPELSKILFQEVTTFQNQIYDFSAFYEHITHKVPLPHVNEIWFVYNLQKGEKYLYEKLKRTMDIAAAFVFGFLFLAVFPFAAAAITLDTQGPILYRQTRLGKHGKPFTLWKFRSMVRNAENGAALWAQENDSRITRIGNVLRKTYLDELPQCINILRGEMSLIGPRPERPEFVHQLEQEIPFYHIRHLIKPGLTGWAQIHFPYGNSKEGALEKLQYELYYIKHRSLLVDLKVLLKTFSIVVLKETASCRPQNLLFDAPLRT